MCYFSKKILEKSLSEVLSVIESIPVLLLDILMCKRNAEMNDWWNVGKEGRNSEEGCISIKLVDSERDIVCNE